MANTALDNKRGGGNRPAAGRAGHGASSPTEIPGRGWLEVLKRTFQQIGLDRVPMVAGAVTYFSLLALFPALTALVSVYALFADPAAIAAQVNSLSSVVPQGGMQIINQELTRLTQNSGGALSLALFISVAIALWSASAGVKMMFEAMNIAYDERESRNFFVLNGLALLFTLGGIAGAMLLTGVAIVVPSLLALLGPGASLAWLFQAGSYVVLALVMLGGISVLYRWGPNRKQTRWRWITPGAVLAVVAIMVMSVLFSWYAANFANYDKTYGSLGGLIGMLTWMWLSITVLIVGAELDAEVERQSGQTAPRGAGSATMKGEPAVQDTPDEESTAWQAGYAAARRDARPRPSLKVMMLALPVALALDAMRRKRNDS